MKTAQLYRYSLPVETGIILRNRRLKQRDGLIIHLQHADKEGWGEIAPLPEFSQETLAEAEIAVRQWIEKWLNHQDDSLTSYPPSVAFGVSSALA
ncbi:o-succinylbenzoate synthase, partial [Glaesserella parasuis]|nr:o-succinylbenzoate synthase [Glaesserella parasuis]MDE4017384.1 o-succinylbenzoate synthase [Glaesserella parasuis]